MKKLFRYSGSKTRYLKYYRSVLDDSKRIVEPYLGSGAYSLNNDIPSIGYEINSDLFHMWIWLKSCTIEDLMSLNEVVEFAKTKHDKFDVRHLNLPKGQETYVRLSVCSAMVGQLSSWKIYNKHNMPIDKTSESLDRLKFIDVVNDYGENHIEEDGDFFFVDPPYINTSPNYQDKTNKIQEMYDPANTKKFINRINSPIIFTYGSSAPVVFPEYNWELVKEVKVPNLRNGGTVTRNEYVAYINF